MASFLITIVFELTIIFSLFVTAAVSQDTGECNKALHERYFPSCGSKLLNGRRLSLSCQLRGSTIYVDTAEILSIRNLTARCPVDTDTPPELKPTSIIAAAVCSRTSRLKQVQADCNGKQSCSTSQPDFDTGGCPTETSFEQVLFIQYWCQSAESLPICSRPDVAVNAVTSLTINMAASSTATDSLRCQCEVLLPVNSDFILHFPLTNSDTKCYKYASAATVNVQHADPQMASYFKSKMVYPCLKQMEGYVKVSLRKPALTSQECSIVSIIAAEGTVLNITCNQHNMVETTVQAMADITTPTLLPHISTSISTDNSTDNSTGMILGIAIAVPILLIIIFLIVILLWRRHKQQKGTTMVAHKTKNVLLLPENPVMEVVAAQPSKPGSPPIYSCVHDNDLNSITATPVEDKGLNAGGHVAEQPPYENFHQPASPPVYNNEPATLNKTQLHYEQLQYPVPSPAQHVYNNQALSQSQPAHANCAMEPDTPPIYENQSMSHPGKHSPYEQLHHPTARGAAPIYSNQTDDEQASYHALDAAASSAPAAAGINRQDSTLYSYISADQL